MLPRRPRHRYLWSQWIALSRRDRFARPLRYMNEDDFRCQYGKFARVCAELARRRYSGVLASLPEVLAGKITDMLFLGKHMFADFGAS